jgi:hypothetical protein
MLLSNRRHKSFIDCRKTAVQQRAHDELSGQQVKPWVATDGSNRNH